MEDDSFNLLGRLGRPIFRCFCLLLVSGRPKQTWNLRIGPLEKEIPIENHHFQVPAVNFRRCTASDLWVQCSDLEDS